MRSLQKRRLSVAGSLITTGAMIVLGCRLGPPRTAWNEQWGTVPSHRTFPGDCGICHVGAGGDVLRKELSFDHEKATGYRLEGAHTRAACLRCHNDQGPVMTYVTRGCAGCHGDPHASALGSDCESCHGRAGWKPVKLAARDFPMRFHLIPAHVVPPCTSCHVEAGVGQPQVGLPQCGPCHGDPSAEPVERSW